MIVRYGEGAAKLEGAGLSKFASGLKEYFGFFDKVNKRLRDEKITELLPRLDLSKRADFEGEKKAAPKKIEKLEKELKKLQKERDFKSIESPLRRRAQSMGSEVRQFPGRRAPHQLGAGFDRRVSPTAVKVQAGRTLHGAAVRDRSHHR